MAVITCVEDLRRAAQRRVPRMFYDYADSGSWTESTYRANVEDFRAIKFRQRVACNMENRSLASTLLGEARVDADGARARGPARHAARRRRDPRGARRPRNPAFPSRFRP
jgi:hypothetical protein